MYAPQAWILATKDHSKFCPVLPTEHMCCWTAPVCALHPKNVPFSKLKLISVPEIFLEDAEHYEVETVLKHKGSVNDRIYWVKWKGYPNSENTWVPAADFDAPLIIQKYWNSLKTQRRSKQQRVY